MAKIYDHNISLQPLQTVGIYVQKTTNRNQVKILKKPTEKKTTNKQTKTNQVSELHNYSS